MNNVIQLKISRYTVLVGHRHREYNHGFIVFVVGAQDLTSRFTIGWVTYSVKTFHALLVTLSRKNFWHVLNEIRYTLFIA